MSYDHLVILDDARAFEATRRFDDLELFHVDFDELTGQESTEYVLARMAARRGRVAVIGPSGSGKSSVMAAVLGPFSQGIPDEVVPLRIPVAGEANETVTHAGSFGRHLVHTVTRWASSELFSPAERDSLDRAVAERRRRAAPRTSRRYSLMTPGWFADMGFAVEVRSAGEDIEARTSSADALGGCRRLIDLFRAHELEPFLVIDDSDSWLQLPDIDRSPLATGFFTEVVRMLATELDCGFVIAVHDEYLQMEAYARAESLLSAPIEIPRFADAAGAIGRILEHRIRLCGVDEALSNVVEADALAALEVHYHSGAQYSLRDVLKVADRALQHACSDSEDRITKQLVLQALAEWL